MVWKSAKTYGIWAQTCDIPGSTYKCAVALKTDEANIQGTWKSNVGGRYGQCANVDR